MRHRHGSERADDQVVAPELLAQSSQIAGIAAPDEPWPEHSEVPAVLLGKAPRHPLLPPFGDCIAVASVDIRRLMERRVLVEDAPRRTEVIDREGDAKNQPSAGVLCHVYHKP